MSSIVSGYEYDIFISYRHNNNRSGCVTEFVAALQEELAATYEVIWVYNHLPSEKSLPPMEQAIQHSLQLDDAIAESHLAMARMKMIMHFNILKRQQKCMRGMLYFKYTIRSFPEFEKDPRTKLLFKIIGLPY